MVRIRKPIIPKKRRKKCSLAKFSLLILIITCLVGLALLHRNVHDSQSITPGTDRHINMHPYANMKPGVVDSRISRNSDYIDFPVALNATSRPLLDSPVRVTSDPMAPFKVEVNDTTSPFKDQNGSATRRRGRRFVEDHACSNFIGLLHIASGDQGAAAGTLFFQYVVNQLLFAEKYNLMPFVYLNNVTSNVYDNDVHSQGHLNITVGGKLVISWETDDHPVPDNSSAIDGEFVVTEWGWPGRPYMPTNRKAHRKRSLMLDGDGVWTHYFEPISPDYDPHHPACQKLPYARLEYRHLNPGLQFFWPMSVRSWEYTFLPYFLRANYSESPNQPSRTLKEWFAPQRKRAHDIIERHYRFQPHLVQAAESLVPREQPCLGIHIRHSDKAGKARHKIDESEFELYVRIYLEKAPPEAVVYVATDSSRVLIYIRRFWSQLPLDRFVWQSDIIRSAVRKPVFGQGSHNRTNTEVLIDILTLSKCDFMVHGFSAVSESAHYLAWPNLHNLSVDLEDDQTNVSSDEFGQWVSTFYASGGSGEDARS